MRRLAYFQLQVESRLEGREHRKGRGGLGTHTLRLLGTIKWFSDSDATDKLLSRCIWDIAKCAKLTKCLHRV